MERLTMFDGNKWDRATLKVKNQDLIDKLAAYEDAEEKGLLLRLPCKVGDTVWAITSPINLGFDEGEGYEVFESSVDSITFYKNGKHQIRLYSGGVFVVWYVRFSDFGKMVFLTNAEAEKALEEMGEVKFREVKEK